MGISEWWKGLAIELQTDIETSENDDLTPQ